MTNLTLAFLAASLLACGASQSPTATPTPMPTPVAEEPAAPMLSPVAPTPSLVEPMSKLHFMDGVWVGPAKGIGADRKPYSVTQVERMGPMLGGDIIVIEGRGFGADGATAFNALAVVSWNSFENRYEMRSYAQGHAGTFELKLTDDGYIWEIPAGPGAITRFTATIKDGSWREVGEYIAGENPGVQIFEMNLVRVADTEWPLGTPVGPEVAPATTP